MEIARGDLFTVALAGDYGKPRPALIVQANAFAALPSVTLLPLTSDLREWSTFRIAISPTSDNGLTRRSQIMIDKAATLPRGKIGKQIGRLDSAQMRLVDTALMNFLGLG
jgi:mRNA interferase MazF